MAPIVKLFQGKDVLDLNSGRYCLDDADFLPPTTAREVTFGRAAVGQELASKRRANRSWGFSVNIEAASISEAERAMRDLQAFLNRAGESRSEPLYVGYRAWNDHTYEPFFGQFGALARYEVVNGYAELASEYLNPLQNSNRVVRVAVSLTIKPQALGLRQRAGQAKGRIYEDFLGTTDGKPRGTWLEGAAASALEFTNPVFMSTTAYDNGWSIGGTGTTKAENLNLKYVQVGTRSLKFSSIQTDNSATLHQSVSVTSGQGYRVHCILKRRDGGAITSSELGFVFTGTGGNSWYLALGNGWYWCGRHFTATSTASVNVGFYWNSPVPVYFDTCSVIRDTNIRYPLKAAAWGAHTTANTAAYLRYKFADFLPARNQWTIRVVWKPPPATTGTRSILQSNDGETSLSINSSDQIFCQVSSGNSVTSSAITITEGTPIVIHATYNGDTITVYNNGSSVGTASSKTPASSEPASFYVGSNTTPTNHCYGTLMGVATFAEVMSATEVDADYDQVAQLITDDQRVDPLPYFWTNDGDDIIDNEQTSTDRNFAFISGLIGDDVDAEIQGILTTSSFSLSSGLVFGVVNSPPSTINCNFFDDENAEALFAVDGAGTADTSANNNVTERQSQNTTVLEYCDSAEQIIFYPSVRGKEVYGWTLIKDAGSNLQIRLMVHLGGEKLYSDWRNVTAASQYWGFLVGPVTLPNYTKVLDMQPKLGFAIEAKRTTAGAANLDVSHAMYLVDATYFDGSGLVSATTLDTAFIKGREVVAAYSAGTIAHGLGLVPIMPRSINIKPNNINGLLIQMGGDARSTWTADDVCDFDQIGITPRWDIY